MKKQRMVKFSVVALAVVGALALALVMTQGTSEAGGPGGRGRGANAGGAGANGQGQGIGMQANANSGVPLYQNQCDDCLQDGSLSLQQQNGAQGQGANPYNGRQQAGGAATGTMSGVQNGFQNDGMNPGNQAQLSLALQNLPPAVAGEVPADVVAALQAGWQDEYHAYATYGAIIDTFGAVNPFVNIQRAEAQHMAALETIFARYDLAVPAPSATETPVFASVQEACAAGAAAEIANLDLYDQWMATVQDYPDIVQVFAALRDASAYSHLPAFENCAG